MKKLVTLILSALACACMAIGFAACGGRGDNGQSSSSVQPEHVHNYLFTVIAPTCTEQGYTTYTCACGDSYVGDYVRAVGHNYTATVTKPTCTQQGYTIYVCSCGNQYVADYKNVAGHSFTNYVSDNNATYETDGTKTACCDNVGCSAIDIQTIANSMIELDVKLTLDASEEYYMVTGLTDEYKYRTKVTILDSYRGKPIKEITDKAFQDTDLKEITLGNNITSIGGSAFYDCDSLTSVTIGNGVTSIGEYVFYSCDSLTSITVSENNPNYSSQDGILYNKEKTEFIYIPGEISGEITIPDSVTKIDSSTFSGCDRLTSITVSENNPNYSSQDGILYNKEKTKFIYIPEKISGEITIPDNVTSIGGYTFAHCDSLTSVTIGNGVTSIGHNAFYNCSSLTSITIPDSVTSIGGAAFSGCSSLQSITLPFVGDSKKTASDTYQYPFGYIFGTSSYTGGVATKQYYYGSSTSNTTNTTFYIPASLTSVTVTGGDILYGAFAYCYRLTSITIPDSVTEIGVNAFAYCYRLTSITIPDSVTSIGYSAFEYCHKLVEVVNESSLNITAGSEENGYVGYYAKQVITDEKDSNIIEQDDYLFYNDNGSYYLVGYKGAETELMLPDTVNGNTYKIYEYAFAYCYRLTSVTISNGVTSIGHNAFYNCSSLTSITISDGVTSIGDYAFEYCRSLTSITIPDGVTSIGSSAFAYCSSLTSITIPDSVTSIGSSAFAYCSSLTSITIPNGVTSIGYSAFSDCDSLTSITIPDSVTSIGGAAFFNCGSLTSITIPVSVTSIGVSAFFNCGSLTSITIPVSVTSIGDYAFYNCSNLTIYCEVTSKPRGWSWRWDVLYTTTSGVYQYHGYCPVVWGYTANTEEK